MAQPSSFCSSPLASAPKCEPYSTCSVVSGLSISIMSSRVISVGVHVRVSLSLNDIPLRLSLHFVYSPIGWGNLFAQWHSESVFNNLVSSQQQEVVSCGNSVFLRTLLTFSQQLLHSVFPPTIHKTSDFFITLQYYFWFCLFDVIYVMARIFVEYLLRCFLII